MSCVGEIENREAMQRKRAVVDARVAAYIDDYFMSVKLPIGVRKLASSNCAVINQVVIGTGLLHYFAGERKRSGRSQHDVVAANAQSGGCGDVVEASCLGCQIVGSVTGFDVVVVRATVETEMSGGSSLSGVGVVGGFVGAQIIIAVVDLGIAVQAVEIAFFLLLLGADERPVLELRPCPIGASRTGS